jgi:hypothetical protein
MFFFRQQIISTLLDLIASVEATAEKLQIPVI